MEPKSSEGDVLCYICGKNGHKAKDCCGVGCSVCGKLGHDGWGCNEDRFKYGRVGTNRAICYYCRKARCFFMGSRNVSLVELYSKSRLGFMPFTLDQHDVSQKRVLIKIE
ncbi:DNA-binding protein HEXBP [Tanacetum coccineum]